MNILFALIIIVSLISGALNNAMPSVSDAAINGSVKAVELFIYLVGGMSMWGGLMRVAEKSGLVDKIAVIFKPILSVIFKGIDLNGKAYHAICMNVTANLLGLGNAATPLGLEAMKKLELEEKCGKSASRNMIMLVLLNTSSITLIPTTVASMRIKYGAEYPLDILPAVIITSITALTVGIIVTFLFEKPS